MPGYEPASIRFWRYVRKTESCWHWIGATGDTGYGRFNTGVSGGHRAVYSHRYAWERLRGPIPVGLVLDHLCGNRLCVNPDHLEPVTMYENTRRGNRHRPSIAVDQVDELRLF